MSKDVLRKAYFLASFANNKRQEACVFGSSVRASVNIY